MLSISRSVLSSRCFCNKWKCSVSALPRNIAAIGYTYLLGIWNVADMTARLNFTFWFKLAHVYQGEGGREAGRGEEGGVFKPYVSSWAQIPFQNLLFDKDEDEPKKSRFPFKSHNSFHMHLENSHCTPSLCWILGIQEGKDTATLLRLLKKLTTVEAVKGFLNVCWIPFCHSEAKSLKLFSDSLEAGDTDGAYFLFISPSAGILLTRIRAKVAVELQGLPDSTSYVCLPFPDCARGGSSLRISIQWWYFGNWYTGNCPYKPSVSSVSSNLSMIL